MAGIYTVGFFLFSLIFSLATFVLWLRIALTYWHVSSLHPIRRTLDQFSNSFVNPLSELVKSTGILRPSRFDWISFALIVVILLLKFTLLNLLFLTPHMPWSFVLLATLADVIIQPCHLLFYAILIRVVLSWITPLANNLMAELVQLITEPLLAPARRHIPAFSGIDFSPFIVLIGLKVISLFISTAVPVSAM